MNLHLVTASGRTIDAANPKLEDIELEDIAIGLSREERFDSNTTVPYSVAQHSCHVADYVASTPGSSEALVKAALLHDAAEAYLGDIVAPLKQLLPDYQRLEQRWSWVIFARFGISHHLINDPWVKRADLDVFACEVYFLVQEPHKYGISLLAAATAYARVHGNYLGIDELREDKVLNRLDAERHFLDTADLLNIK